MITVFVSLCAFVAQDIPGTRVRETRADGAVLEFLVRETASGETIRHGEFTLTDGDGTPRVLGEYREGAKSGRWNYRNEAGKAWVSGSFKDGQRSGKWNLRHPEGSLRAKGTYKRGGMSGSWQFELADGSTDDLHSGEYRAFAARHLGGEPSASGQLLDDSLHGRWVFHWANGREQLRAEYERGTRVGEWRFVHPDGTPDPGLYAQALPAGSWPHELDHEPVFVESELPASPVEAAVASPGIDVSAYAEVIDTSETPDEAWRVFDAYLVARGEDRAARVAELVAYRRHGLAPVLAALRELDLGTEAGLARAIALLDDVVTPVLGGHALLAYDGPRDASAVGLAVLRAHALFMVSEGASDWWELDLHHTSHDFSLEDACSTLLAPPYQVEAGTPGASGHSSYAQRFLDDRAKLLRARGGTGTEQAVARGLQWMVQHQEEDGHWAAQDAYHDVGVTSLVLLSLMADGHTTQRGRYRDSVLRGFGWLLDQQDLDLGRFQRSAMKKHPDTGQLVQMTSHVDLYNHAVATQAICELASLSESPAIRASAQAAVNFAHGARNPYGAWRYEFPPVGDNDTSITGWMVAALLAGERAGIEGSDRAAKWWPEWREGASNWFLEMTDAANGRCGYDELGSLSSRVPGENDQYPRRAEPLTAIALWSQLRLGLDPEEDFLGNQHADLLLRALPEWDPEGLRCDVYAWYQGTYAMQAMGSRYWKAWNTALKQQALGAQRQDGDTRGSWDPVGPWGYLGGRAYSTAMVTMALQSYYRFADNRPLPR